ncbi:MAG: sigma-54 dependent transcriptional regulator [Bacteroidota bacterium]
MRLLIVDDEKSIRNTLKDILSFEGYEVFTAESGAEALDLHKQHRVDGILLDIKMKGMDGIETLKALKETDPEVSVIMISGHGSIDHAVEATKIGAFDFIQKPPDLNRLLISVRNALVERQLKVEMTHLKRRFPKPSEMVGSSKAMTHVKDLISRVSPTDSRVLITGENGTGKELVAQWIHAKSKRVLRPFVAVNCAAIPAELIESELFGHEEGAFTGAVHQRIGKFEQANNGTLFLDEIGDMPLSAQVKLLRVLQESCLQRVGGNESVPINVRILSATNKDLSKAIAQGEFREDLYHRLNVIPIVVPPLRDRREDIPIIAEAVLASVQQRDVSFSHVHFTGDGLTQLKQYGWSGNVRELYNAIERLSILAPDGVIDRSTVQQVLDQDQPEMGLPNMVEQIDGFQAFKESSERLFLVHQLKKYGWNISETADAIGIQRSHLYNKINKYKLERDA